MIPSKENYFKKETRDNFVISEVMKRCWATEIQAICDIKEICDANGLIFFAAYGTLLGTVRHGGYIPWDDDIDIGIIRDDYISLLNLLSKNDFGYNVLNPYTKPWFCMNFTHITNSVDLCFNREYLKRHQGCPFITGLDIFPYYYIPRNSNDEEFILYILGKIDNTISLYRQSVINPVNKKLKEEMAISLVELQKETGYSFSSKRPMDNQLEILYDQICRLTPPESADYLTRYNEYMFDKSKKFPKECLEAVKEMPFENIKMPVPEGYRDVLTSIYGQNYLIPKRENAAHEYPFFKRQLHNTDNRIEEDVLKTFNTTGSTTSVISDTDKTIVIYHTNIRELIIYSECAIKKIQSVINAFSNLSHKCSFYWVPGIFLKTDDFAFDEILPDFIREYEEYINRCKIDDLCSVVEYDDLESIAEKGDVFYGDESILSDAFRKRGHTVIIQDYTNDDELIDF